MSPMSPQLLRQLRQLHLWFGMLIAPSVLFFTFSGMLQTFDFHETERGVAPPKWIATIAQLHKKQALPRPRPPKPAAARPAGRSEAGSRPAPARSPWPLKIFVGLMSIGLLSSTIIGVVIALGMRAYRRVSIIMLAIGTALPIALIPY